MELDADALKPRGSAGVEPRPAGPHHGHLQPRQGVALVAGEPLQGEVGGQQWLREVYKNYTTNNNL